MSNRKVLQKNQKNVKDFESQSILTEGKRVEVLLSLSPQKNLKYNARW